MVWVRGGLMSRCQVVRTVVFNGKVKQVKPAQRMLCKKQVETCPRNSDTACQHPGGPSSCICHEMADSISQILQVVSNANVIIARVKEMSAAGASERLREIRKSKKAFNAKTSVTHKRIRYKPMHVSTVPGINQPPPPHRKLTAVFRMLETSVERLKNVIRRKNLGAR